ncbi:MAG: AraC family transcriptional regulator, partial [Treponema sp.]|nr:AraC family transcriptional regulator [Treponema sp.]
KEKISAITLIIDYDFLHEVMPDIQECVFDMKETEYLKPIKDKMLEIARYYESEASEHKNIMIKGIVYEILYFLCNEHIKKSKLTLPHSRKKNVGRLRDILSYIDKYYEESIQQGDVAKLFFLSRSYFARFFKSYTGITFQEYLTRFRLVKAEDKLRYSEESITEIAMDTGFSDTRYFINSFRKYYNKTPYQYRLSHKRK